MMVYAVDGKPQENHRKTMAQHLRTAAGRRKGHSHRHIVESVENHRKTIGKQGPSTRARWRDQCRDQWAGGGVMATGPGLKVWKTIGKP